MLRDDYAASIHRGQVSCSPSEGRPGTSRAHTKVMSLDATSNGHTHIARQPVSALNKDGALNTIYADPIMLLT